MGIGAILKDRQLRRIHTLFYEEGLVQVQVARKLRVSQSAVSQRIATIRRRYGVACAIVRVRTDP